jgi:CRP/FNR family transcriptional regulator, cyclic AMP receptor protein
LNHVPDSKSLKNIELFEDVSDDVLAQVESRCRWVDYDTHEVVVDLNDTGTDVYFVVSGKVRATVFLTEEIEISLADLVPGDTFGEMAAVDLKMRSARVTTLEPTVLAEVSSEDFRQILLDHPEISLALLRRFASLIRSLTTRVTVMSSMTPHQRVYNELLRLSEPDTAGNGTWIIANAPAHSELSTWIGSDKQTVATAIGNLARDGIIERKHKALIIKDHDRLQRLTSL